MEDIKYLDLIERLNRARSEIERKIFFLAWLNKRLREEGSAVYPVLVGGTAVEFYTFGGCASFDIDLVYDTNEKFENILKSSGFSKRGRYWENKNLDLLLECPGSISEKPEKLANIEIEDSFVLLSSIEEIIIDRLNGFVFWDNCNPKSEYLKQLKMLLSRSGINYEYLEKRAKEEGNINELNRLIEGLK